MYLDKEDAINIASDVRKVIAKLREKTPYGKDKDTDYLILDLEYNLDKLDREIEECPTLVRNEQGKLV